MTPEEIQALLLQFDLKLGWTSGVPIVGNTRGLEKQALRFINEHAEEFAAYKVANPPAPSSAPVPARLRDAAAASTATLTPSPEVISRIVAGKNGG